MGNRTGDMERAEGDVETYFQRCLLLTLAVAPARSGTSISV